MAAKRLAIARLWFEGNRFSPLATAREAFERREWQRGAAALATADGTATELAAVVDFGRAHGDWRIDVSRCASASPGGPIERPVFDGWLDEVLDDLRSWRPDAVYLSLHGAAITTASDTPDLEALAAVRAAIGAAMRVASFELHANLSPRLTDVSCACARATAQ